MSAAHAVCAVVVNWNAGDELARCVRSLHAELLGTRSEIIVVDNASTDGSLERLEPPLVDGVVVIRLSENIGFAPAVNVALRRHRRGEFILLLNPDAVLASGALAALLARAQSDERVGAVGPLIVNAHGAIDPSSARRDLSLGSLASEVLGLRALFPCSRWLGSHRLGADEASWARSVECLSGAGLLVRESALEEIGGRLDESLPLYFEDMELCRQLRDHGYEVWFEPSARLTHLGAHCSRQSPTRALLGVMEEGDARWLFIRQHSGRGRALAASALIAVGSALRTALFLLAYLATGEHEHRYRVSKNRALLRWAFERPKPVFTSTASLVERRQRGTPAVPSTPTEPPEGTADGWSGVNYEPADGVGQRRTVAVIIPARNEEAVIARCLESVIRQRCDVSLRIIVVVNGTTDGTAAIVRTLVGCAEARGHTLVLLERACPSKPAAMNAGDQFATGLPRAYVDADVVLSTTAISSVMGAFDRDRRILLASPPLVVERSDSSLSRAYAGVWSSLPYVKGQVMGVGFYAVAARGRSRWREFPELLSDDKFVRLHFAPSEQCVTDSAHISLTMPSKAWDLVRVRSRWLRGNRQLRREHPQLAARDQNRVARSWSFLLRSPRLWMKVPGFGAVYLLAQLRAILVPSVGVDPWERAARPLSEGKAGTGASAGPIIDLRQSDVESVVLVRQPSGRPGH